MMCTAIALQFYAMWRFEQLACVMVHETYLRLTDSSAAFMTWHDKTDTSTAGKWKELPAVGGPACPVRLTRELLPAVAAACAIWGSGRGATAAGRRVPAAGRDAGRQQLAHAERAAGCVPQV